MDDDAILAQVMRRLLTDPQGPRFVSTGGELLEIDATTPTTPEEDAVLTRYKAAESDGPSVAEINARYEAQRH